MIFLEFMQDLSGVGGEMRKIIKKIMLIMVCGRRETLKRVEARNEQGLASETLTNNRIMKSREAGVIRLKGQTSPSGAFGGGVRREKVVTHAVFEAR